MKIGPAEAKSTDARPTGRGRIATEPGAGSRGQVEGAARNAGLGVGCFDADRRRQDFVVQRESRVDQSHQSRRALRMADERLDRPERAAPRFPSGLGENVLQSAHLGEITGRGAGAVGFDVLNCRGRDPGVFVGSLQSAHLALESRGGQALRSAVAGRAKPFDHGVNRIAVALGVGQPFENDDRHALANHDPVRRGVERPAAAARRERLGFAEGQIGKRVLHGVHAAEHDHVGRARLQLANRDGRRRQRRSAGGVHREIRAAEIEPIGHSTRRDVQKDSRKRVLGPFRQQMSTFRQCLGAGAGNHRVQQRQVGAERITHRQLRRSSSRSQHHGRPLARESALTVARVVERRADDFEGQQMKRLDRRQARRRHPVAQRVKGNLGDEPAPSRRDLVWGLRVGVIIKPPVPAVFRYFGDRVDPIQRVLPEPPHVARPRGERRHADNRNGAGTGLPPPPRPARFGIPSEEGHALLGNLTVKLLDCGERVPQGRRLAEHIQTFGPLRLGTDRRERRTRPADPIDALGGDPQPPDVQALQRLADLGRRAAFVPQGSPSRLERIGKRRGTDPHLVARAGLQQDRRRAGHGLLLIRLDDRARLGRLASEQVGGPDQRADLDAARRQTGRDPGDNRR